MSKITSRDRVLKAVNHQQPDRIPLDLGSTLVTGITKNAYLKLANVLGFQIEKVELYDTIQQLAVIEEQVLEKEHFPNLLKVYEAICDSVEF